MKIQAIRADELFGFLRINLYHRSFSLFMHLLGTGFVKLFCELPSSVKKTSVIYLDSNKSRINDKAVRKLRECGYNYIYYVPNLHAKILITQDFIVVGSANFTARGTRENREVVLIIWENYRRIRGLAGIIDSFRGDAVPALVK